MSGKKLVLTPQKVRRRRPSSELARPFMCNQPDCERRYEEFRTLQQHLQVKHGVRVSLRDKSTDCSVFDVRKSHPESAVREATPSPAVVASPRAPPVAETSPESSPQLPQRSEPGSGQDEDDRHSQLSELMLDETDMELLHTLFLHTPALPYTEDEIVNMYVQCLKDEAQGAYPGVCDVTELTADVVPDHNGNYHEHVV